MITVMGAAGHTGRKIAEALHYVPLSYSDMTGALVQAGLSESFARQYVAMTRSFNEGAAEAPARSDRTALTPTLFEDFADELARAYRALWPDALSGLKRPLSIWPDLVRSVDGRSINRKTRWT